MSSTPVSNTYTSAENVNIPDNHVNLTITVNGARGGQGYGGGSSRAGGDGRNGTFQYLSSYNFTARSLVLAPGDNGDNGGGYGGGSGGDGPHDGGNGGPGQWSYQQGYNCDQGKGYARDCGGSCGCCSNWYCGGSQGNGDPCCGGAQGTPNECFCCYEPKTCYNTIYVNSGGGGGGGSSSAVYDTTAGAYVAISGGGGGGARSQGTGAAAADWTSVNGNFSGSSGSNGGNGGQAGGTGGGGGGAPGNSYNNAAGSKYNTQLVSLSSSSLGNTPSIVVSYDLLVPEVGISASPNPQTSGLDGVPNYNTTISLSLQNWQYAVLTGNGINQTYYPGDTLSYTDNNLPQSVVGSNSPATVTYTVTAYAGSTSVTDTLTVEVTNDEDPSTTNWTTTFSNLEKETEYSKNIGQIAGVDMVIEVSCEDNAVFFANGENGSYSNPQYFTNGQNIYLKTTTLPYNTDISGLSSNATYGKTNTKTMDVVIGTDTIAVNFVTRAPVIKETFDYDGQPTEYPYEDIDLITNTPASSLVTQTLNMDDIEIDMEIKGDNPDLEIKINNGSWQSIREI